eukprot:339511-Amphidinium_carterae.1
MGTFPSAYEEPTSDQLAVGKMQMRPPYVDVSIFGPHGNRVAKKSGKRATKSYNVFWSCSGLSALALHHVPEPHGQVE